MRMPWRMVLLRTYVLGVLGGAVIAEATFWGAALVSGWGGSWIAAVLAMIGWTIAVAWIGGLIGVAEATVALIAVLLLGPLRRWAPLTCLIGGAAAAAGPVWLISRDGWPRDHGSPGGIALCCAAFAAGALLIWPALTGRPWLPTWLGRLAAD
ncbi:MAG TPA: hypothetical protein VFU36_00560 [Jatrophihabitans sp.]|nr:hypothetical protein [Jatrophihabitans sp.]